MPARGIPRAGEAGSDPPARGVRKVMTYLMRLVALMVTSMSASGASTFFITYSNNDPHWHEVFKYVLKCFGFDAGLPRMPLGDLLPEEKK